MLKVRLHKSWRDEFSDSQIKKIKQSIDWAIDYHNLRDKNYKIDFFLTENFTSSIKGQDKSVAGRFMPVSNKKSEIHIKCGLPFFLTIQTIFHEMTHLKHLLHFDICYTPYGKTWRGERYPVPVKFNLKEYYNLPDERDARHHEYRMIVLWYWKRINDTLQFWRK